MESSAAFPTYMHEFLMPVCIHVIFSCICAYLTCDLMVLKFVSHGDHVTAAFL